MNTNWDVEELAARRDETVKGDLLRIILAGNFWCAAVRVRIDLAHDFIA